MKSSKSYSTHGKNTQTLFRIVNILVSIRSLLDKDGPLAFAEKRLKMKGKKLMSCMMSGLTMA